MRRRVLRSLSLPLRHDALHVEGSALYPPEHPGGAGGPGMGRDEREKGTPVPRMSPPLPWASGPREWAQRPSSDPL